ncbi:MAG: 4-hydroxythreonine-4-phosphate dehydrogenase PdxA [Endomicrobiales bacterium]|jgi:4-hydroxythreonine-4-phosphate dehydrogenase
MALPRIVITLGDPSGVGPEIVLKALTARQARKSCKIIVVGDKRLLTIRKGVFSFPTTFVDVPVTDNDIDAIRPGIVSAAGGRAAYTWLCAAVKMISRGDADALVTAPLSKEALHLAGCRYPGHTELLAALTGTKNVAMMMASGSLWSVMMTRHVPLKKVSSLLCVQDIVHTTQLSYDFLRNHAHLNKPRIVMCALNPHAGEAGLLGKEESTIMSPAIKALRSAGIAVAGPVPADTAWRCAREGLWDLIVTMYHDQTMIPLKIIAPEKIVNITVGLPFIRTSPGHGTAFDIAGKNCADPRSMIEAIGVAASLT